MYPEHQEQSAAEGDLSPVELGANFRNLPRRVRMHFRNR